MTQSGLTESSIAFQKAEQNLEAVIQEIGADRAYELLRHPIQNWLKQVFLNRGGQLLEESTGTFSVLDLLDKMDPNPNVIPPENDHPEMYHWEGKPLFYVYHPYNSVNEQILRSFCDRYGLDFKISADSWYFVGRTLRVTIFEPNRARLYWQAIR